MHNEKVKTVIEVLLVDDDLDDRNTFRDALSELRIETRLTMLEDGRNLIGYLQDRSRKRPDILFLDLNMPYRSGVECLADIRRHEEFSDLSIAIYSTSATDRDVEETFIQGANIYIRKPTSFTKLKQVLNDVVNMNFQFHHSGLDKDTFLLSI